MLPIQRVSSIRNPGKTYIPIYLQRTQKTTTVNSCSVLTGTLAAAQVAVTGLLRAVGGRTAAVAREQAARAVICFIGEAAALLRRQSITVKCTDKP